MKLHLLSLAGVCVTATVASAGLNINGDSANAIETAAHQAEVNLACAFTTECFDTDGCSDTAFDTSLTGQAGGEDPQNMTAVADFITDAETVPMVGARIDGALHLSNSTAAAQHMITITQTGETRYSVHLADGPMVITYAGICTPE